MQKKKSSDLKKIVQDQKAVITAQTEAKKQAQEDKKVYVETLLEKLAPDPRVYSGVEKEKIVELEIDRLLKEESDFVKQKSDLEKEIIRVKEEKQAEIDELKREIEDLKKHADKLEKRVKQIEMSGSKNKSKNWLAEWLGK